MADDDLTSIAEFSRRREGVNPNDIFTAIRDNGLAPQLQGGMIPGDLASTLDGVLGLTTEVEVVEVVEEEDDKPREKVRVGYNFNKVRAHIDSAARRKFRAALVERGEDMQGFPARDNVFYGLAYLMRKDGRNRTILSRQFPGQNLADVVADIYPDKKRNGDAVPDNVRLIRGAQTYLDLTRPKRSGIYQDIQDPGMDNLNIAYTLRDMEGSPGFAMGFVTLLDAGRQLKRSDIETLKKLDKGMEAYRNMTDAVKRELFEVFESKGRSYVEFAYWLQKSRFIEDVREEAGIKGIEASSYLIGTLFAIRDHDEEYQLTRSDEMLLDLYYTGVKHGLYIQQSCPDNFVELVARVREHIEAALVQRADDGRSRFEADTPSAEFILVNEETGTYLDVDKFIEGTLVRKAHGEVEPSVGDAPEMDTYTYFNENYGGRGVQYTTFINYITGVLIVDAPESQDTLDYVNMLQEMTQKRLVEKVDRLRGDSGRTKLVNILESTARHGGVSEAYREIGDSWRGRVDGLRQTLIEQGCWIDRENARSTPFSFRELKRMDNLVNRFGYLFPRS